jgi:hypothetical protein
MFKALSTILGASAALVAILSYFAPQSYPIIHGPELYACPSRFAEEEKRELKRFVESLLEHQNRNIYIDSLQISIGGCGLFGEPVWNKEKRSPDVKAEASAQAKILKITYSSLYEKPSETYILIIHTNLDDYPFGNSNCNENCVGASGVYRVKINASEGFVFVDISKSPIVDSVAKSYECTLNKLEAKNFWKRFWACRI